MDNSTGNISINARSAEVGINADSLLPLIKPGVLSWAVNAILENFDGNSTSYQNEQANVLCAEFPIGYKVIGIRNIIEEGFAVVWLYNPSSDDSEIGIVTHNSCTYSKTINSKCLGFSLNHPILKHAHRNTNCGLEVYWVDGDNRARWLQFENLPYKEIINSNDPCHPIATGEIDCNKLNLQPDFTIPTINITGTNSGGSLLAGAYQFTIQYGNSLGEPYTSFYSTTNPADVFDGTQATQNFDFPVNKAISLQISNLDTSGIFDYFNLAVIKTINNISSVELVGTFNILGATMEITYTGQGKADERLTINDVFQRYEIVDSPAILTTAQDVLILADLKEEERISYQAIANQITPKWATYRLRGPHPYSDSESTAEKRSYMRDEIYPLEAVFLLKNGYQTDGFHIPGRIALASDLQLVDNADVPQEQDSVCPPEHITLPRWKVYNTASITGTSCGTSCTDPCYEGEWQFGEFAYWESTETYPCNDIYGELQFKPIRHHKFPDSVVTHIHDEEGYVYPIGIKIDVQQIVNLINASSLTADQKANIQAVKIVRGNRVNNSSVVAKGLLTNVLKYNTEGNIIDASTGAPEEGLGDGPDASTRRIIDNARNYTHKAHTEANQYYFFTGAIFVGQFIAQNGRYDAAEDLIQDVLNTPDVFTQLNVQRLQEASGKLQEAIDGSGGDARGKAHAQAAKALVDGAIQIMEAQISLNNSLAGIDLTTFIDADANKYIYFPNYLFNDVRVDANGKPRDFFLDNTVIDESSKLRYAFHSPDTSFYQPFLGNILKLETIEYGVSSGHIKGVQQHAKYQFISATGYILALLSGLSIGFASGTYGVGSVNIFDGTAMFTAYQAVLQVLYKTIPRKNFANQFNAVGDYSHFKPVLNDVGNKQRNTDIAAYLSPGMINIGDNYTVNNFQRESSVYLRTTAPLPYTHQANIGVPEDASKLVGATFSVLNTPISSYYGAIKNLIPNQYGQLYSYETVDTGWERIIDTQSSGYGSEVIFGGDTFINKFAYKSKIPFFIDNRVGFPDDADVSYNELSNVGRVKYWFSTDVVNNTSVLDSIFATMTQNFFWPRINELYMGGMIFLFAYGIPYFFCESSVNVDMRQAYNSLEGDFYPRTSSGIPDEWLQEKNVSIQFDNTYWYNKSFSKQNKETFFSHIPSDYDFSSCRTEFPFRAIFSEPNTDNPNPSNRNNWRIFKPAARFDFPQNYGPLTSLDGLENKQVLARFENKSLLYNALLVAPTSAQDVYLGSSLFSQRVPPLDYAETDTGWAGSQNKMLIKTEYGHISVDARRGQIFLYQGTSTKDLSSEGLSKFFSEYLRFALPLSIPSVPVDNPFNGIGIHGVYDTLYNRLILTKLDYIPLSPSYTYSEGKFFNNSTEIFLSDTTYFKNNCFTVSYDFDTGKWISFHTYIPNYYVGGENYFYSGINAPSPASIWRHNTEISKYNNFYGSIHPYILEYPYSYQYNDEILQNVKDYTKALQYTSWQEFIETDDYWWDEVVLYNAQQNSGIIKPFVKPKNNLSQYKVSPVYNSDSKEVFFTKRDNFYLLNTFWNVSKTPSTPNWLPSTQNLSIFKELNQSNMDYNKRSFLKQPLRAKDLRIRFTINKRDDTKFISIFTTAPTQVSFN